MDFRNHIALFIRFLSFFIFTTPFTTQSQTTSGVGQSLSPINPVIVTATRTPKSGNDILADYTYISREEIENSGQSSLADLLQQQRGIQISSTGGAGNTASVYVRGTNNGQTLVLIDNVKIDTTSGGAAWNAIPLSLIDHIEIIYGPQSTFYGSDAMGGVIQIFTKKGGGPTQIEASSGYGTYNTSINNASIYGSLGKEGQTNYSIGLSQENSAGFNTVAANNPYNPINGSSYPFPTSATGYTRLGMTGSLSNTWANGQELGIKIFTSKNNWQYPYNAGGPETDIGINRLAVFSAFSKNQINSIWGSYFQLSNSTNSNQTLGSRFNDKLVTPAYNFLWQNDLKIGADKLQILIERNMQYAKMNSSPYLTGCQYGPLGACGNLDINELRTTNSIAGSYEFKRGNNLATVAIRNDQISQYGSQFTYSAAYGYFFTRELRANINYGTGFRAPSFNDLYYPGYGNLNLKTESNRNFETGIHYETKNYGIHLTAYQNRIENFIIPINCPGYICSNPANYSGSFPENFSLVQIKGASLGIDANLKNWTIKASGDAMSTVDQTTGLSVPYRANVIGNLLIDYKYKKLNLGSNLTYSGARWGGVNGTQTANINAMPSYTIVSFYGSHVIDKSISAFFRWNNAFNTNYQTNYGFANAGSNIFAGLRFSLK